MPWEVAIACNVQSHDCGKGSHDPPLYTAYLSRLFDHSGPQLQAIVDEVFESDHSLLSVSLSAVLEQEVKCRDHTHTEEGLPRSPVEINVDISKHINFSYRPGSHMIQWADPRCLKRLVDMCVSVVAMGNTQHVVSALTACQDAGYMCCHSDVWCCHGDVCRYWLGAVRLLVAIGDRSAAIMTILSLGDMKLLTQPQSWGKIIL